MSETTDPDVIDLDQYRREQATAKIVAGLSEQIESAKAIFDEYLQLFTADPSSAVSELPLFIDRARNKDSNSSFVEAVTGGPCELYTVPLLNVLGIFYRGLDRDVRIRALRNVFSFLNRQNYLTSQDNVALINDPWLCSDILVNSRGFYWPGFREYSDLLAECKEWRDLYPKLTSVKSDFWLAYTITLPEYSSLSVRHNYYSSFPNFLVRAIDAIAAIVSANAKGLQEQDNKDYEECLINELREYDPTLHEIIRQSIEEEKWIVLGGEAIRI